MTKQQLDELKELEELELLEKKYSSAQNFSEIESGGLGALQSATFGFADEAEASLRSLIPSQPGYQDLVKQVRERYEKSKQDNPISYGAGEFAGALALPIPGSLLLKTLPKAGKVASGARSLIQNAAGLGLKEAKTLAELAKAGAKTGAVGGALYGAGQGEGLEDTIKDAAIGGVAGAGMGAVLNPALMKSIEGISKGAKSAGKAILGSEGQAALNYAKEVKDRKVDFFDPKQLIDEAKKAGDTLTEVSDKIVNRVSQNLNTQKQAVSNYTLKDQDKMVEDAISELSKLKPTVKDDVSYIEQNIKYLEELLEKPVDKTQKIMKESSELVETPIVGKPTKAMKIVKNKAVDIKPDLESKLNAELKQRQDLGEDVQGQIKELVTPQGEKYYYPEIISRDVKTSVKEQTIPGFDIVPPKRNLEEGRLLEELNRLQSQAYEKRIGSEYRKPIQNLEKSIREEVASTNPNFKASRTENQRLSNLVQLITEGRYDTSGELADAFTAIAKADKTPEYFKTVDKIAETLSDVSAKPEDMPKIQEARRIFTEIFPEANQLLQKFDKQKEILGLYKTAIDPKTVTLTDIPSGGVRSLFAAGERKGGIVSAARIKTGQSIGNLAKMTDEAVNDYIQKGTARFGSGFNPIAEKLSGTFGDKTGIKRTAAMFSLMQDPSYRQMLNQLNQEQNTDEQESGR